MKSRADIHLSRKAYHSLGVCVVFALYAYLPRPIMLLFFTSFTALCLALDLSRLRIPRLNTCLISIFRNIMRDYEHSGLTGMTYMTLGVTTICYIFPPEVVKLSLLMLAFGDPISSIFGILYGKDKLIGNKSLQGTLAGFITCSLLSLFFFIWNSLFLERIILFSLFSGIIGAFSEVLPIKKLDDNLTFPIISSALLWTLFTVTQGI